jgi:hypothetical protein
METNHHFPKHSLRNSTLCVPLFFLLFHAWYVVLHLEALLQSRCDGSEVAVHLGWRATKNEGNNGGTSHVDVLESCAK